MINTALKIVLGLAGTLFLFNGVRWLVVPGEIAPAVGLPVSEGLGLSTLVGDLASFFMAMGSFVLIALITERRTWYYPPIMMLTITALGRIIAWLLHDATLAVGPIRVEVVVALLLFFASRRLPKEA